MESGEETLPANDLCDFTFAEINCGVYFQFTADDKYVLYSQKYSSSRTFVPVQGGAPTSLEQGSVISLLALSREGNRVVILLNDGDTSEIVVTTLDDCSSVRVKVDNTITDLRHTPTVIYPSASPPRSGTFLQPLPRTPPP